MNANNPADKAIAERINAKLAGSGKGVAYECGLWRICDLEGSRPLLVDDLATLEAALEVGSLADYLAPALAPEEGAKQ